MFANYQKLIQYTFLILLICANSNLYAQLEDTTNTGEIVDINLNLIQENLSNAPVEFSAEAGFQTTLITLPLPLGQTKTFSVQESPVLDKKLSVLYPEIKSYILINLEDGSSAGRLNVTPKGVSSLIHTENGIAYLENQEEEGKLLHKVYYSGAQPRNLACSTISDNRFSIPSNAKARFTTLSNGSQLRTYRIAIATAGEFYQANGNNNTDVNAAITTHLNNLNAIYEKELAMRFVLIAANDNLLFTDGATDNLNPNSRTTTAQSVISSTIASADYDIGHVLYTIPSCGANCFQTSGVAGLGVVCQSSQKARGWTGATATASAELFLGTFAHEIAHQFGGDHTFYGTTGNCSGSNRSTGNGYEPGSGNSLMSYEGNCSPQNIDPKVLTQYFHIHSLIQILAYANGVGNCATTTVTGNTPPVITVPNNVTIPKGTPFTLSGSGTDADGDNLTYIWEQYDTDNTAGGPPNDAANSTTAPLFRSFDPSTTGNTRDFPHVSNILANSQTQGEILPQVARPMTFQLTARDKNASGGGIHSKEVTITVDNNGPFAITSQNGSTNWTANGSNTANITWDVNGTNTNCPNIDILFSTDGGITFPYTLASSISNDGAETITIPNYPTPAGRIKVKCSDNIFFDINNSDVVISSGCLAQGVSFSGSGDVTAVAGDASLNLSLSPQYGASISSKAFTNTVASSNIVLTYNDGGDCTNPFSNNPKFSSLKFIPTTTGNHTFSFTASTGGGLLNLYKLAFSNAMPCTNWMASSIISPNFNSNASISNINLTAGVPYILVVSGFSTDQTGNYTINISNPVYEDNRSDPGVNYTYTYVAINSSGMVSEIDSNADFTSLTTAGDYTVYGFSIINTELASFNAQEGQSFVNLINGTYCANISSNTIQLTISALPCSNPTPSLGTITSPTTCGGTNGSIQLTGLTANTDYTLNYQKDNVAATAVNFTADGSGNYVLPNLGAGIYSEINVTISTCTSADLATTTLSDPADPSVNAISNQTVCANQSTTAISFSGTGSSYTWTNNNTSINLAASGTGNIGVFTTANTGTTVQTATITVTPKLNGCDGPTKTFTITVNPLPSVNVISNQTVCANQSTTAISFGGTGTSYTWTNNNTSINLAASGTGNIGVFTTANTGTTLQTATITVTPKLNGCDGPTKSFTITVNPLPSVNAISNQTVTAGDMTTAINFSGTGTSYTWMNDNTNTGLAASGTGDIAAFTTTNAGVSTITVTPVLNSCNGATKTFTITVNSAMATCANDLLNVDTSIDNETYSCDTVSSAETIPGSFTVIYEGCKEVVLKSGFQYAPTGSATFTARVTSCGPLTSPDNSVKQSRINTQNTTIPTNIVMTIHPNPARDFVIIDYQLKKATTVSIGLFDLTGKQISSISPKQTKGQGVYQQQVALGDFNTGIYFVVLQTEKEQISKKMILLQ